MDKKIAVIGLGYVGLPVALEFAKKVPGTIGFDINQKRIDQLKRGIDETEMASVSELAEIDITYTADVNELKGANFFVVAVPTPVDESNTPDLTPLERASETVAQALTPGSIVVYESTVYPGVTEEVCGPILERISGLKCGEDFKLGYSPERINPGDTEHTITNVIKSS